MSWITFIWSFTSGICLTLGVVHFLVWTHQRGQWANLMFSISAIAAAGYSILDMAAMRAQSPAEYGELFRWILCLGLVEGVTISCFVHLYLQAGRLWLLWLICGLRALMLLLNFVPGANFYFREITSLKPMPLLGELIAHPQGELFPWVFLMPVSLLLIIIFALDAARTASKQSGQRRPWVMGGLVAVGFSLALVSYALYVQDILPSTFSSQLFLLLILLMGYELSRDLLRATQVAGDLRESEKRLTLAADAVNLGFWIRDIAKDKFWVSDHWRKLLGFAKSERIDFDSFMQKVHPEDRQTISQTLAAAVAGGGSLRRRISCGSSRGRGALDRLARPSRVQR